MTTPIQDGTSAGLLDYCTHYYEFIPEEEHDSAQPNVLEAHELQEGNSYYILLTMAENDKLARKARCHPVTKIEEALEHYLVLADELGWDWACGAAGPA